MRLKRENPLSPSNIYIEKAATLSKQEAELLNQRLRGSFTRRRDDAKYSAVEVVALQLEFDDSVLNQWRTQLAGIRGAERMAISATSGQ
jgi:hypothetical protein